MSRPLPNLPTQPGRDSDGFPSKQESLKETIMSSINDFETPLENMTDSPNSDLFAKCLLSSEDVRELMRDYDRDIERKILRYNKTISGTVLEASSKRIG